MHLVTFERRPTRAGRASRTHSMRDLGLGFEAFEFTTPGRRRLGARIALGADAGAVIDLNRALAVKLAAEDVGAPEAEADSLLPGDALGFLRAGRRALDAAREAMDFALEALDGYDGPDLRRAGVVEPERVVRLCAPLSRPGKIIAVVPALRPGGGDAAPHDLLLVAPSAVIGPEDEIVLPRIESDVYCTGALALVVGRSARHLPPERALESVAGCCAANAVAVGEPDGGGWIGRSCDGFAPLGPALVTRDEVADPQSLEVRTTLSGEPVHTLHLKELGFDIGDALAFASQRMTLEPGDVVIVGPRPAADAGARLRDGDVVEVEVERLGRLRNPVRGERAAAR
jgi:2-keto-4-pentenoate hydratase/2-oxohepta-3-ene-1,7-dioic acid hydratase in catechol pathway